MIAIAFCTLTRSLGCLVTKVTNVTKVINVTKVNVTKVINVR